MKKKMILIQFLCAFFVHSIYAQCTVEENNLAGAAVVNICEGGSAQYDVATSSGRHYTGVCPNRPLLFNQSNSSVTVSFRGTHSYRGDLLQWRLLVNDGATSVDVPLYTADSGTNDDNFGDAGANTYLTFTSNSALSTTPFDLNIGGNNLSGTYATSQSVGGTHTNTQAAVNALLDSIDITNASIAVQIYDCSFGDVGVLTDAIVSFNINGVVQTFTSSSTSNIVDAVCNSSANTLNLSSSNVPVAVETHINWYPTSGSSAPLATNTPSYTPSATDRATVGTHDYFYNADCYDVSSGTYNNCPTLQTKKQATLNVYAIPVIHSVTANKDCNDNYTFNVSASLNSQNPGGNTMEYSLDGGTTWTVFTSSTITANITTGNPANIQLRNQSAANATPAIAPATCYVATQALTITYDTIVAPTAVCQNISAYLDASGNAVITPAMIDNGSSDDCTASSALTFALSDTIFTCTDIGENPIILYVTDEHNNTAQCNAVVTILDTIRPTAMCQNITVQLDANGAATITPAMVNNGSADNCATPALSIDVNAFDCTNLGANNVVLTATDASGNVDSCTAVVTVEDKINPVALCKDINVYLSPAGTASIVAADIDNGSFDNCYVDLSIPVASSTFDCNNVGANTVVLTATDSSGNTATCSATVTVMPDSTAPSITCQNTTIYLDAMGMASVSNADLVANITSICGIADTTLGQYNFTCANVGATTISVSTTDINGLTATCNAVVTILDTIRPTAMCQNITVQLDANGAATITPAMVNNGSTDNCAAPALSIDVDAFDCTNLGANNVVLTATDASGNVDSCTAVVTVEDNINPVALCKDINVYLSPAGTASIVAADIDNGSFDNCYVDLSIPVASSTFDCSNVGANTVVLTATDSSGNTATCSATITVMPDSTAPSITCQNTTIYLDAMGMASVSNADLVANITSICGIADTTLGQYNFTCANVGATTVSVSTTDINGLTATCNAVVTVLDTFSTTVLPYTTACTNSSITLEVSTGRTGATVHWYSDAMGNNLVHTGNPFETPNLSANTTYWVNEHYGNGCTSALVQVDVVVQNASAPVVSSNSPVCPRETLTLETTTNGVAIYSWSGPNGFTSSSQNPSISNVSASQAGTYQLVVTTLNGCVSDTGNTTVVVNPETTLSTPLDAEYTYCEDGLATIEATTTNVQTANWTGPNGFSSTGIVSIDPVSENQHEGIYTLVLTDNNTGCASIEYTTFLEIIPRPVINSITGGNSIICPGESFTLEASQVNNANYYWTMPNGNQYVGNPLTIDKASEDNTGMFSVYAQEGSCYSDTLTTDVGIYPRVPLQATAEKDTFVESEPIVLTASGAIGYEWTPATYIDNVNSAVVNLSNVKPDNYTYMVYGIDQNTCIDSTTISFVVVPEQTLVVYDIMTPNNDGYNDTWHIGFLDNISEYTLKIFDRGGMQLYEVNNNYQNDWNGTYNGKALPEGTYFYVIDAEGKQYKGGITIVR